MSRARTASSAVHESQLIGSILADEEPREREGVEVKDPIAARSTSAPPQLAIQDGTSVNGETILPDDLRLSPEYYNYYYSQKPLDPRLPPPVFNWSSWHYATRGRGAFGGISEKDFIVRAGLKLGDSASLTKDKATIPSGTASGSDVPPAATPPATSPVLSSVGPLGLDEPSTEYLLSRKGKSQTHPSTHIFSVASSASTSPRLQARTETFEDLEGDLSRRFSGGLTFRPTEPEMERETFEEGATPTTSTETDRRLGGERDRAEHGLSASGAFPSPSLFPSAMSVPYAGGLGGPRRPFSGSLRQTAPVGTTSGGLTSGSVPHMYPASFRSLHGTNPVMAVMGYGHSTMLRGRTPELGPSMVSGGSIGRDSGGLSRESFPRRPPATWVPEQSFSSKPSHGAERSARPSYPRERHKGRRAHGAFPSSGPLPRDPETKSFVRDHSPLGKSRPVVGPTLSLDPSSRSWLDDFRLNKTNSNLTLKDVVSRGLMLELATDQYGSRFIQQKLETASGEEKQAAFEQLLPETLRLCTDVFGNYVIQKFFEHGTFEHKRLLASKLTGNVLMLSLQMYGCRVVQKAIDVSDADTQALLVRELNGHVMECVKDQNGNHVIQKCIEKVPPYLIQFIVEAFSHQIFNLSTHPYGCRVIQRLLENCSEAQRNSILSEILENVEDLCKNQYGNYVIQHVLVRGTPFHRGNIIRAVRGKVLVLAKHKFASNVIEKCFAHASRQHRAALVEEVLGKEDRDPSKSPLIAMVKDQYANYVIQKMVDVVDEDQRAMILHRIKRHVPNLRKIPYGKHIIARIEKLTGKPIS